MLASSDAETALRRLGALLGFYRSCRPTLTGESSRRLPAPLDRANASQLRTLYEATIVRAVSIVEAFVLDLGDARVRERLHSLASSDDVPKASLAMVEYLRSEKWTTLTSGSWDRLVATWSKGLGVPLRDFVAYDDIVLLRLTRHAIAHRLGEYTSQYRQAAASHLRAAGIDPDRASGLIPLTEDDVDRSVVLCRSFVLWLDGQN